MFSLELVAVVLTLLAVILTGRRIGPGPGRSSWTGSARWTRASFARLPRNGGATGPRLCQPATA